MNNELKKKLIDFDTKIDELWESMESIQFDNPELLDELGTVKQDLIKAFDNIKNKIFCTIPKEVYGISKREETEESVEVNTEESVEAKMYYQGHGWASNFLDYDTIINSIDKQYWTHVFCDGKWCLASEVKE